MDIFHQTPVVIKRSGSISFIPPGQFTNPCILNGSSYPFEILICKIKFGSWAHSGNEIDLELKDNVTSADVGSLVESPEWKVLG